VDPLDSAVVSIGKMENDDGSETCGCGHTFNIICGRIVMHGTSRAFSNAMQYKLREAIERVAVNVAKAMGATATVVRFCFPKSWFDIAVLWCVCNLLCGWWIDIPRMDVQSPSTRSLVYELYSAPSRSMT
jgi:hypothetical protein